MVATYLEFGHQEGSQRFKVFFLCLFALLVDERVMLLLSRHCSCEVLL